MVIRKSSGASKSIATVVSFLLELLSGFGLPSEYTREATMNVEHVVELLIVYAGLSDEDRAKVDAMLDQED